MRGHTAYEATEQKKRLEKGKGAGQLAHNASSVAWLLLRLNVMFLVFCIPVLTAPAALSAMTKVLMNIVRNKDSSLLSDFLRAFKESFLKSLAAGLIMGAFMAAVFFAGYSVYTSFGGFIGYLGIALIIVLGAFVYFALCYLFPLIVTVDISLKQCVWNSFALALTELRRNLLLLMPLALVAACALLYPVSLPLLIFIMFALCEYIVCLTVAGVIHKRIIDPYYSQRR